MARTRFKLTRVDALLLVLIAISLAGSFATWQINERVDRVAECNAEVTTEILQAVNERTAFSEQSAQRNNELVSAQQQLLTTLLEDEGPSRAAIEQYAEAVSAYTAVQARTAEQRETYPYPSTDAIERCR